MAAVWAAPRGRPITAANDLRLLGMLAGRYDHPDTNSHEIGLATIYS